MNNKRIVFIYNDNDDSPNDVYAEYIVDAVSDWQAIHIVAEHHPEIKTMDFDVMTKGVHI